MKGRNQNYKRNKQLGRNGDYKKKKINVKETHQKNYSLRSLER